MYWAILILGGLVVVGGLFSLSQATMGVGIVAIGCFLGIAARVLQASAYHKQITEALSASALSTTKPVISAAARED